jgi:hypothetical protein
MKKPNQKLVLEEKIAYLKNKQTTDFYNLKEQYHQTIESFTPINIIKNSFESILKAPNLKANLLNQALNYGISFIEKNTLHSNVDFSMQGILGKIFRFALKKMT